MMLFDHKKPYKTFNSKYTKDEDYHSNPKIGF